MKKDLRQNKIALILMSSSLLLLGLFLVIWLKQMYAEEINRLQEKSSFIFINTIRKAETDFIKKDVLEPILATIKGQGDSLQLTAYSLEINDSITTFLKDKNLPNLNVIKALIQTEDNRFQNQQNPPPISYKKVSKKNILPTDSNSLRMETTISINLDQEAYEQKNKSENIGGLLNWVLNKYSLDSIDNFSLHQRDSLLKTDIKNLIKNAPRIEDMPPNFKVITVQDSDSAFYTRRILSETFQDVDTGNQYALSFDKANGFIFQKMLPELLFSTLLFSITALSFFFIYKNLLDQQSLTALKNELISNITHELKTPISTVGVAIEALQSFGALDDKERTKEYLDISQQELNRLSILVDKVLNTSLFDKKEMSLKKEKIDFQSLVQEVLNTMKLQFQNKKAIVDFEEEGNTHLIQGDKIHLTSVIYNLIDNALKYSPLSPKLLINIKEKDAHINFSIKDNGLGIPAEFKDKIFDKFFRIPTGNEHNIKGHGLGLNYVKKVIEKHQGQISFQSKEGEGTLFMISLPKSK